MTALRPLGARVVGYWFAHRHDSPFERNMARSVIRDAQLWKRLFVRPPVVRDRERP